ncbi:MAG TPA: VapC toxin family PIN domain ribonuclease [Bacteroidales bacterium]|nr:VapC toxin family PIN domain ribonuclease [Bacteroidales bacterium]
MNGEDKRVFIDTNILIYANYSDSVLKDQARSKIIWYLQNDYELWISRQVIREFLVYITRFNFENEKLSSTELLNSVFNNLDQYNIAEDSNITTQKLRYLIEKYELSGKKIHDANIVATMQEYNITKLLTHNIKDFERFINIIEIIALIE